MRLLFGSIALLAFVGSVVRDRAEEPQPPHFIVSVSCLGPSGGAFDAEALVAQMNGGWCVASAGPRPSRWNKRPENAPASEWVSVVLAGFGSQADAFVFMFDGAENSPRLLAHLPYNQTPVYGGKKWIVPAGPIADSFRLGYRRSLEVAKTATPTPGESPRVSVKATAWQGAESAAAPSGTLASVSIGDALPSMEAMLCAALCENGFTPTFEQSDRSVRLEVRFGFKSGAMRVTRQTGAESTVRQKEEIPEDRYFGFLTRMLFMLKPDSGISDFALPVNGRFNLLTASAEKVCGAGESGIAAFDPRSGKRLWASTPASPDIFANREDAGGAHVFRTTRGIAAVNLATGTSKDISPDSPESPWAFSAGEDGTAVVARAAHLSAHRNGAVLWKKDESSKITAGPVMNGNKVFAGTADGDLFCLGAADGAEMWRKNSGGEWRGPVVCTGQALFALSKREGDAAWVAVNPADGTVLWKQPIGDMLLNAPAPLDGTGAQWLVAAKNNRILLLNAADGKIAAEIRWPTWVVDVRAISVNGKSQVACTDIRGRLSILDAATLKTLREVSLPERPSGNLLCVPRFPETWGSAGLGAEPDLLALNAPDAKSLPAILVADGEGFCYVIRIK